MLPATIVFRVSSPAVRVEIWCPCGAAAKVDRPSYGEVLACGEEGAEKAEAESPAVPVRCEKCGTYVQVIWCLDPQVTAKSPGKAHPSSPGKNRGEKVKKALSSWFVRSDRSR